MTYFQVGAHVRPSRDNPKLGMHASNDQLRGQIIATHQNVGGRPVWVVKWSHPVRWPNRPEDPCTSSHYEHLLVLDIDPNSFQGRVMSYIDREINNGAA